MLRCQPWVMTIMTKKRMSISLTLNLGENNRTNREKMKERKNSRMKWRLTCALP